MIVIVIGLLRTNLSGLYRHRRGIGFTWSRLQGRKHNIRIAKLAFHAKESPIRTRAKVLSLVSSRFNSTDVVHSPAVRIPPNPELPQCLRNLEKLNSWDTTPKLTLTISFSQSILALTVFKKGLPNIIGQKISCGEPRTRNQ